MKVTIIDGMVLKFKDCKDGCPFFEDNEYFICHHPKNRDRYMTAKGWDIPDADRYCPLKEERE